MNATGTSNAHFVEHGTTAMLIVGNDPESRKGESSTALESK